jgi:hypothetical protein
MPTLRRKGRETLNLSRNMEHTLQQTPSLKSAAVVKQRGQATMPRVGFEAATPVFHHAANSVSYSDVPNGWQTVEPVRRLADEESISYPEILQLFLVYVT